MGVFDFLDGSPFYLDLVRHSAAIVYMFGAEKALIAYHYSCTQLEPPQKRCQHPIKSGYSLPQGLGYGSSACFTLSML